MDKAEEIRDDMRHRVAEQCARNARSTVAKAVYALREVLTPLSYSELTLTQEAVAPALAELQALVKLIQDAAPSLPRDETSAQEIAA